MIFSTLEQEILEEYRRHDPGNRGYPKYMLINMLNFKNNILRSQGQPEEDQECFCEVPRRKEYHISFFEFYDKYKENNAI